MERIRQNTVALDRQIARLGGNGISRLANIDDALFNLESAIASYTLSPGEASICEVQHDETCPARFDAEDEPNPEERCNCGAFDVRQKLSRIASTEEASQ